MKRIRKGSATLEALICSLIVLFFLMLVVHIYFQVHASLVMNVVCADISHDVVSCTSLDEAQQLADDTASDRLRKYKDIDKASLRCDVYYAVGGEQEWKKGNFLTVELSAPLISPFSATGGYYRKRMTVMIERNN